jgi:hypothetical protein
MYPSIHVSKISMISKYPLIQLSKKNQYPRYPSIRISEKSGIRPSLPVLVGSILGTKLAPFRQLSAPK